MARRGGVHGARRRQRAGAPPRCITDSGSCRTYRRIVELDGREGLRDARRHPRPRGAERDRLEIPEPEVRHQGAHRPPLHPVRVCHIACEDTSHQAITATKDGVRHFEVVDSECVGCNLCMHVCPVEQCITMERVDSGDYANWTTHPNNPASADAGRVQARRHPRSTRRRLLDGVRRGRSSCIVAFRSTGPASVDAGADVLVECVR